MVIDSMKTLLLVVFAAGLSMHAAENNGFDYRVMATTKTGTMEKEMNQAAEAGYIYAGVMGGESAFGGKETLVVMRKQLGEGAEQPRRVYKLLATSKTGTMDKELHRAGEEGFEYCGATVFESAFGGREVAVILEKQSATASGRIEYKLLATSKTSTMQKELQEAGASGFVFKGVMVGKTAFGGNEVISILARPAQ
jgi:hypothetical protein